MRRLFLIIITILYASTGHIFGKEQFIYTQISQKEGLTSTVNCIYKEKNGEVWIGSPSGLYHFNGNTLKHCTDSCLTGKRVFQTSMDAIGNFWVLTNKGAIRRKPQENTFHQVTADNHETEVPFYSLCHDDEGIWFGSNNRIFRYTYRTDCLKLFCDISSHTSFLCRNICILDHRTLLCSSHNGIILIDTITGNVSKAPYGTYNEVSSLFVDNKGRIWVAFYNNGIEVFQKDGTTLKRYTTENSSLSNNVVLCMNGLGSAIWAGTDGGGINIINPDTDEIKVLSHVAGDPSSLPAHSIKSIYIDDYDNIWAGSIREGLIRISYSGMKTYSDSHIGLKTGLSNPTVLCLYQDRLSKYIWIGTDGEGLNRFNPETGEFTHYSQTLKSKVVSIATYSDEELALSIYAEGIWLFNRHTGDVRPLQIENDEINYMLRYAGRSMNLANDNNGDILLISNIVNRFDKDTHTCTTLDIDVGNKANGNLQIIPATGKGLWMHDYYNIYHLPENSSTLIRKGHTNKHMINSGHMDADGLIWLATDEGLCRFNTADNRFSHIKTTLLDNASSVACDRHSRVWVGTDNGLYAYLKESESFTLFGESDGASPNEYLSKPHLLSKEGDVYLGGVQGLLYIDNAYMIDMTDIPSVSLYSFTVDNQSMDINSPDVYRLPRNSKTMEISVASQEKDIFREKVYRFMISGTDAEYESKSPTLKLQQIPAPGKYEILVTCTKRNGEWSAPISLITFIVPQPWYFSAWFITCMIFLFVISFITAHVSITRRRNNRLQLALKEQEQKIYEDKVQFLINISHELRTPLTLIIAPLKRLLKDKKTKLEEISTLNRIYRQSRRMSDLLDMVLDLRKMEVGKNRLKLEQLDFNMWINDSIEDIRNEESEEGITIVTELDPDVGTVTFDKGKCNTVLTNVLINAIKHSTAGDRITIRTSLQDNRMVRVSISDEGPGLGNIDMSKMFTRFYQSNNEQYGSGIGLSYSKILIEMHGGRIGAENNIDKGATFWWELPLCLCEEDTAPIEGRAFLNELLGHDANADIQCTDTFDTTGMTLMVVDDNTDLLDFMREALKDDFSEVITATSGNKALSIIAAGRLPDIIVSDVNMPDGNGYQLCSNLKQNERYGHIPVVLLTARGEDQSQSDSYRLGADAFMAKPFEIETLLELLKNILKRKAEIKKKYLDMDEESVSEYGSNEESFILNLNRIISEHLDNPDLDQQLICQELGVSRALLYNRMKSITGSGAKEYITRIRLEKAKTLIETTSLPIAEISEKTGFASQSYFSTAFKAYTGLTPSQYKRQYITSKE